MRRLSLPLAALLALAALGSDDPKGYDGAAAQGAVFGEWSRVGLRIDGRETGVRNWVLTIRERTYAGRVGGGTETGTCRVEGAASERLELVRTGGDVCFSSGQFLFRVEGDTLTLAYYNGAEKRPESFDAKDLHVSTFKRVRK